MCVYRCFPRSQVCAYASSVPVDAPRRRLCSKSARFLPCWANRTVSSNRTRSRRANTHTHINSRSCIQWGKRNRTHEDLIAFPVVYMCSIDSSSFRRRPWARACRPTATRRMHWPKDRASPSSTASPPEQQVVSSHTHNTHHINTRERDVGRRSGVWACSSGEREKKKQNRRTR